MADSGKRTLILALLSLAQLMIVLDFSIVNVALPSIEAQFHLTPTQLQWVVSAYALTFGGFLLLGGRASDIFSRKKVFLAGLIVFSIASFFGGLGTSATLVFIARAAQGLGAAMLSPSALSLLTTTFEEGESRNRALGIFSSMAAIGFTAGVILGGILTSFLSWHWVFFVNVPIGISAIIAALFLLPKSSAKEEKRGFDITGAALVTTSLVVLVFAVTQISVPGESTAQTLGLLLLSFAIGASFLFMERRASYPLVPLNIFRRRRVVTANILMLLTFMANASLIFIITLFLQGIRGFSPIETGLIFVPGGLGGISGARLAPRLVRRRGYISMMAYGLLLFGAGTAVLTFISLTSSIVILMIAYYFLALGLVSTIVSLNIAGTSGVERNRQGLAAGLLTTSQQIGAAIGVSVASVVATSVAASMGGGPGGIIMGYRYSLFLSLAQIITAFVLALYTVRVYSMRSASEKAMM